jgi:hypothetical protein
MMARTSDMGPLRLLAFAAAIYVSQPGHGGAQPAPTSTVDPSGEAPPTFSLGQALEDWLTHATMTGDWGGLRARLSEDGFNFRASYVGEYAYSFSGGKRIGAPTLSNGPSEWTWIWVRWPI